jgi:DNA-directed RNA polymerase subunit RPC12/RpoP
MSKAYKNGEEFGSCNSCGEWSDPWEWNEYEVVTVPETAFRKSVYDGDSSTDYIDEDDTNTQTLYQCPHCEYWFQETPEKLPVWKCGTCNNKFLDSDEAGNCC